jgi:hypothetical protein
MKKEYQEIARYNDWREKRMVQRLGAVSLVFAALWYWLFFG